MAFSPIRFLSTIRGFLRFFFQLAAFGSFMLMIYLIAVWVEKTAISQSQPTNELPPLYIEEIPLTSSTTPSNHLRSAPSSTPNRDLNFPYPVDLTSREGVTIETVLLSRPSRDRITFRKKRDNRVYTIETARLHENSRHLIDAFAVDSDRHAGSGAPANLLALEETSQRSFPVSCTLTNIHGKRLQATLLERPGPNEITFRRHFDHQVFTIPVDRLSPGNRAVLRQFPLMTE